MCPAVRYEGPCASEPGPRGLAPQFPPRELGAEDLWFAMMRIDRVHHVAHAVRGVQRRGHR